MSLLSGIWGLVPNNYKWSVAIKKIGYTAAKVGVAYLASTGVVKDISPQNLEIAQGVVAAAVAGTLTLIHDWAQVKWPKATWL